MRQLVVLGHDVIDFPDGTELCEHLRGGSDADLVWSDLEMPSADGFEVMSVAHAYLPKIPILIVSGHTDADHLMRALQAGATAFLPKPFGPSELKSTLRRIEALRITERNEERAWQSLRGAALIFNMPADLGVAAAVAAMIRDHSKACLGTAECHGLYIAAHEILLNAIEHGCLEITREEKIEALLTNVYGELVATRQVDPRFSERLVNVRVAANIEFGVEVTISDPGPGFDPTSLPDVWDAENLFLPSGRGIVLAGLHVDELKFSENGRTAHITVHRRST